jgi:RNA polymerase sigma-70 factor (ECF subfamily)
VSAIALRDAIPAEVPGLLRYARALVRDDPEAEDLVQETVVRALERADTFRAEAAVSTWLHRILHNLAVDRSRRRRETPIGDVADMGLDLDRADAVEVAWRDDAYTVDTAIVVARAESRAELRDALVRLPVAYRAAVVLHDVEALTVREIADIQSVSLPAAKQRLRRGRMMLVSELARGRERRKSLRGVPMSCWDARSQVGDYLDGDLDEAAADLLRRHLQVCPTCPPLYAALAATTAALAGPRRAIGPGAALRDRDSVVPPAMARRLAALLAPSASQVPDGRGDTGDTGDTGGSGRSASDRA